MYVETLAWYKCAKYSRDAIRTYGFYRDGVRVREGLLIACLNEIDHDRGENGCGRLRVLNYQHYKRLALGELAVRVFEIKIGWRRNYESPNETRIFSLTLREQLRTCLCNAAIRRMVYGAESLATVAIIFSTTLVWWEGAEWSLVYRIICPVLNDL